MKARGKREARRPWKDERKVSALKERNDTLIEFIYVALSVLLNFFAEWSRGDALRYASALAPGFNISAPLALIVALNVCVQAQDDPSKTPRQFWPEVDVFVPINEKVRFFFLFNVTRKEETKENTEGQFGVHADYTVNHRLVLRAGYRYGFSLNNAEPFEEHRPLLEQTLRQHLPLKILLTDRNREEFRWVNGDFSFRYRNRLMLERELLLPKRTLTVYGSVEVYHDSRFDVWNRNRLTAGVQIQLKKALPLLRLVTPRKQVILEIYYTKQNDSRSQPNHLHALGTVLQIHF